MNLHPLPGSASHQTSWWCGTPSVGFGCWGSRWFSRAGRGGTKFSLPQLLLQL